MKDILQEDFKASRRSIKDQLQRLILIVYDVASGMEFLKSKEVI